LRQPDSNIGIATGIISGIVVLDIDHKNDGMTKLRQIEALHGDLPVTVTGRTGNGYHLYFRHPGTSIVSRAAVAGIAGLDIRGDGGYVVAPPSRHASGNEYLWEHRPDKAARAAMPDWLIKLISAPATAPVAPQTTSARNPVPEGQRNDVLFRLACSLGTKGLTETAITAALQAENVERCQPPLAEGEVVAIVRSAARYPNSANSANSASQGSTSAQWDPPIPFHEFDLPTFPTDSLPERLRAFVEAEAIATQTPADLAAMLVLSVCAAACAKKIIVQVDEGWIEPVNIFTATVLKPGNRKSAVFKVVVAPLEDYEEEECRRQGPDVQAAQTRFNIASTALVKAERDAAKSTDGNGALTQKAEELARKLAAMKVPAMPRFIADDSTAERLTSLLHEQGGRIGLLSPEGGVFDLMAGRYSQDGSANFEVYLKGHAGDDLRVDRVSRPAEHVQAPALTLGLAIQPKVLDGLMDKAGFRGRGLLARFLYSLPISPVGRRKIRPPALPSNVRNSYYAIVRRLLEIPWGSDQEGNRVAFSLRLTPEARKRLQALEERLEPHLGEDGDLGSLADWGAKLAGAVMRIAGVLHLVENAGSREPWTLQIEATTVEKAICIGQYLIPHARAAHAAMGADPKIEDAKRVLRWIKRSGRTDFTKRVAFEGTKGHFKEVAVMEPALRLLEEHGYIRERPAADRPGPGRKPSPIYDVNLLWLSQNSHNSQNAQRADDFANSANSANPNQDAKGARTDDHGMGEPAAGEQPEEGGVA